MADDALSESFCPIGRVVTEVGDPAWSVRSYQLVREAFGDERLGRSHPTPETAPRRSQSAIFGGPIGNFATEWEEHERRRRLLSPLFSPKRMRRLTAGVETIARGLLDRLAESGPPADLQAGFTGQLPVLVICELLGVPRRDRDRFRQWTEEMLDESDRARSNAAEQQFLGYCGDLARHKRLHPAEDVLSSLAAVDGMPDESIARLGMALLLAGHETTVVRLGLGIVKLLEFPSQWQQLVNRPELVGSAVEELLRAQHANEFIRYPRTDIELGGVRVRAGELVLLDVHSANHDPAVFADPDSVDIARSSPPHLSFGYGHRYCIGAPLARIEMKTALTFLTKRFPSLRLSDSGRKLSLRENVATKGLVSLPVTW